MEPLAPHATTRPSLLAAKLAELLAATAITFDSPVGTLVRLPPHETTVPSPRRARLELPVSTTAMAFDNVAGTRSPKSGSKKLQATTVPLLRTARLRPPRDMSAA